MAPVRWSRRDLLDAAVWSLFVIGVVLWVAALVSDSYILRANVASLSMQIRDQLLDLYVTQTPVEGRHCPFSVDDHLAYSRIRCRRRAIGKILMGEEIMQLRRDLLEAEVVFLVTLEAMNLIQGFPSLFGFGERL